MNPSFFFPVEIPFKEKERMSGKSKLNLVSMKSLDVLILSDRFPRPSTFRTTSLVNYRRRAVDSNNMRGDLLRHRYID